jgi:hypothetical protein
VPDPVLARNNLAAGVSWLLAARQAAASLDALRRAEQDGAATVRDVLLPSA